MQQNPALDGVRAVAVLAVVAFHCRIPVALGGMIGVDLFFVLSGYLVTSLLREGRSLPDFFVGRIVRLGPAFLLMLAAYAAFAPWFLSERTVTSDVLLAGLYVSDYSLAFWHEPKMLGHTWSLAVEAKFYLLWPLLILSTRTLRRETLLWHYPLTRMLRDQWGPVPTFIIVATLSVCLAWLSYTYVEQPLRALYRRSKLAA